eukprot:504007_1
MSGDDSKIQDNFFIWLRKTRILSLLDEHDITDLEDLQALDTEKDIHGLVKELSLLRTVYKKWQERVIIKRETVDEKANNFEQVFEREKLLNSGVSVIWQKETNNGISEPLPEDLSNIIENLKINQTCYSLNPQFDSDEKSDFIIKKHSKDTAVMRNRTTHKCHKIVRTDLSKIVDWYNPDNISNETFLRAIAYYCANDPEHDDSPKSYNSPNSDKNNRNGSDDKKESNSSKDGNNNEQNTGNSGSSSSSGGSGGGGNGRKGDDNNDDQNDKKNDNKEEENNKEEKKEEEKKYEDDQCNDKPGNTPNQNNKQQQPLTKAPIIHKKANVHSQPRYSVSSHSQTNHMPNNMIFGQPAMINPLQNSINNYQISASLPNSGNNNGNTGNNFQLSNSFPLCINTNNINGHYNAMNLNGHYNAMNLNGHYNAM